MRRVYNSSSRREIGEDRERRKVIMSNQSNGMEEKQSVLQDSFHKVSEQARRAEIEIELQREAEFHRVVQLGVGRLKLIAGLGAGAILGALLYATAG